MEKLLADGLSKSILDLYKVKILKFKSFLYIALKLHGKDWKKVEDYIGTRTGAQIRSHAQKYFIRIEEELNCTGLAFPDSQSQSMTSEPLVDVDEDTS